MSDILSNKIASLNENAPTIQSVVDNQQNKEAAIAGFKSGRITKIIDGDTVIIKDDSTGEEFSARLNANEDDSYFDTVEIPHGNKDNLLIDVISNKYKTNQFMTAAYLYDVPVDKLTLDQINNLNNYASNSLINKINNKEVQPFDPKATYSPLDIDPNKQVNYNIAKIDKYGRPVVDIYNTDKKSILNELANNPAINIGGTANFGLNLSDIKAAPQKQPDL